jgi:hypothetical protein
MFIIQDMGTATTKLANVGMILMSSNYVALIFRNVVSEVQRAIHKNI